ncbi:L-2-hydroxyglutarate oxidase [Pleurocapsa sp. CCALA 161]|uniref:L-2-hydroxyglutarate oxidase n=1 Tax=Pleurocapsa sp. CCALA 161 TaxID=2107688 RepID=UPI000D06B63B|nr:L-2-hydroxyglutarate oxidase [Pleurocapsa sp. CCALA 161]PSB10585.1 L-2-hydroxyglutarate oxidase [Pleurocapsa sp. CCALA 161]
MYNYTIIGGGIVGLSTAMALSQRFPAAKIALLEKEASWAAHQTGHNSGVIHSGIYYKPGSYKAKLCRDGNRSMVDFCVQHNIDHKICGKVIVATEEHELPLLDNLYDRGLANELEIKKITKEQVQEIEPHVNCLAGIRVKSTGIVDYKQVCLKYAEIAQKQGVDLYNNTCVQDLVAMTDGYVIKTNQEEYQTEFLINCGGLYSDRLTELAKAKAPAKIVPFRGEYYELTPEKKYLVNGAIYPVPNPNFPFLGVHFTPGIDGSVHAGPNAVLGFKREAYNKFDFDLKDFLDTMTYPGFWKLAGKFYSEGIQEMIRSYSKTIFVRSLQRLIPEVQAQDVVPTPAGVRAQALKSDGSMVDDFLFISRDRALHVCNAPSPAATASIEIGKQIVAQVPDII